MRPHRSRQGAHRARRAIAIALLTLAPSAAAPAQTASIASGPSYGISLAVPRAEHHAFAGRTAEIPVHARGPASRADALRGRWSVRTSALRAPLGEGFPIEMRASTDSQQPALLAPVPLLRREIALELQLEAQVGGEWRSAGEIPVRAYPPDLLDPLRQFATSHAIDVRDSDGALARFLREGKIPTQAQRDDWAPPAAVTVYAGAEADAWFDAPMHPKHGVWQMVLLAGPEEETGRPAHVVIERRADGGTLVAHVPWLQELGGDPQAQSALVWLFALLHEQRFP